MKKVLVLLALPSLLIYSRSLFAQLPKGETPDSLDGGGGIAFILIIVVIAIVLAFKESKRIGFITLVVASSIGVLGYIVPKFGGIILGILGVGIFYAVLKDMFK